MKQVTVTGQTVNAAVQEALKELNISEEKAEISIIDEGKKGLFGIFGSRPAVVKVAVKEDPIAESVKFLKSIVEKMGILIDIDVQQNGKILELNMTSNKSGLLIGKRGQTLNALQLLTQMMASQTSDQYVTVVLDTENYRKRRNETLVQLAEKLAQKAIQTRKEVVLEPMPSYERKVIHTALSTQKRVQTYSSGSEPNRHIVIAPEL